MRNIVIIFALTFGIIGAFYLYTRFGGEQNISPLQNVAKKITEKPLEKYSFDNLRKETLAGSVIFLGKGVKDTEDVSSHLFYFVSDEKKVSGFLNMPKKAGTYPVIVLLRGFVPKEIFTSGEGTRRTGEYLAQNGFITLAPDYLGFGDSDDASENGMEDRFQTYTTTLALLSSIKNLNDALSATKSGIVQADIEKIGIWGHSNGGHIALSVLAISEKPYPTVLWNPVGKLFPYSILYFTDEYDDHGKGLIKLVADFQKDYDSEKYSPPNYYKYITAKMQLDQAEADEEVPKAWSDELVATLKDLGISVDYFTYPLENHNFNNGSWEQAAKRSSDFFHSAFAK